MSRLILTGTMAKASLDPDERRQWEGMISLFRTSWDSPVVRSMMTTFLDPDADEVTLRVWSEFLRIMGDGPAVAAFLESSLEMDTTELARRIEVPTLVIHGQEDSTVPLAFGRDLASLIPGARFEIIKGADHCESTYSSPRLRELVAEFLAPVSSNSTTEEQGQ